MKRRGFPGGADSKILPVMQETWVQSLGQEDPLEKGMATHSCILALGNPVDRGACWAIGHGLQRVGHDCTTITFQTYLRNILRPNNKCTNRLIRYERNGEI